MGLLDLDTDPGDIPERCDVINDHLYQFFIVKRNGVDVSHSSAC